MSSAMFLTTRRRRPSSVSGVWERLWAWGTEEAVFLGQRVVVMTPRPGRVAAIVDNPDAGTVGYRSSETFFARCTQLRALLAEEGAL